MSDCESSGGCAENIEESSSCQGSSVDVSGMEIETLVVVSKAKKFIREQSGFNTSACCVEALSRKVAEECLKGIASAKEDGRKTVKGRDIK